MVNRWVMISRTGSRISASKVSVLQNCCRASCDHVTCVVSRYWSKKRSVYSQMARNAIFVFLLYFVWWIECLVVWVWHTCVCMNMCTCSWCHLQMLYLCILYKNKISHYTFCLWAFFSYIILYLKALHTPTDIVCSYAGNLSPTQYSRTMEWLRCQVCLNTARKSSQLKVIKPPVGNKSPADPKSLNWFLKWKKKF